MDHQIQTIQVYNKYAQQYADKFMAFDLYNDTFDDFLDLLPPGASLLEAGCGPGNVIRYFSEKRKDLNILGIDLAPEMIRKAAELNPGAAFELLDLRNLHLLEKQFQAITAAFSLPYLSDADLPAFFSNLYRLLVPGGFLYLSCMEGAKERSGFEHTSFTGDEALYIYYHQQEELQKHLHTNGFGILKYYTKEYPEADGTFTTDLIYIAQKSV